jgi:hypothetical protein
MGRASRLGAMSTVLPTARPAMTRKDLEAIIIDALDRADTMHWRGPRNYLAADLILRGLRAAGVKMRGPREYTHNRAAEFMKRLLTRSRETRD